MTKNDLCAALTALRIQTLELQTSTLVGNRAAAGAARALGGQEERKGVGGDGPERGVLRARQPLKALRLRHAQRRRLHRQIGFVNLIKKPYATLAVIIRLQSWLRPCMGLPSHEQMGDLCSARTAPAQTCRRRKARATCSRSVLLAVRNTCAQPTGIELQLW